MANLQFPARLPLEVKDWLRHQSDINGSSINSEIIRAIRERMDRIGDGSDRNERASA